VETQVLPICADVTTAGAIDFASKLFVAELPALTSTMTELGLARLVINGKYATGSCMLQ
jgi:hypothetical protein